MRSEKKIRSDLEKINHDAAGIDIGSEFHYVAVPEDRDEKAVQKFGCFTGDIRKMAVWLKECKITTVAMESTGVYWIPVFQILEEYGFKVYLVNARHIKNVPGRKTDVLDCQWIQRLHTYGLLQASFQPENDVRKLRVFVRHRDNFIKQKSTHIQRMQKNLVQMNIQLHKVISDISGLTGMKIIKSILAGERDSLKLAKMKNKHIKNSEEIIAKSLEGNYREENLFCLKQEVEQFEFICSKISEIDKEIEKILNGMIPEKTEKYVNIEEYKGKSENIKKRNILLKVCNVDLTKIDGIDVNSIEVILSEVGTDMNKWPTEKHFCSWLGLSPNNKISGGKILSSKSKKIVNRAATAFRLAAWGAACSNSAIGAFCRRLKSRLGSPKAITATANKIAKLFYRSLKYGENYVDIGAQYYEDKYRERLIKNISKKARELGFSLKPLEKIG